MGYGFSCLFIYLLLLQLRTLSDAVALQDRMQADEERILCSQLLGKRCVVVLHFHNV
jgi:hypothetical protein